MVESRVPPSDSVSVDTMLTKLEVLLSFHASLCCHMLSFV